MPLDDRAREFLGAEKVTRHGAQASAKAAQRYEDYRQQEFLQRAGNFYEDLMGFFLDQKKKGDYMDDEAIAALALLAINCRESYGSPQNREEAKQWDDAKRAEKLLVFDTICVTMQAYYDENK